MIYESVQRRYNGNTEAIYLKKKTYNLYDSLRWVFMGGDGMLRLSEGGMLNSKTATELDPKK